MALDILQAEEHGHTVLQVRGEVDLYSSPDLRAALLKAIEGGTRAVAVSLAEVSYMDSSGVATLVEALKATGKSKTAFVLLAPSQPVMKVLHLSRLDTVFTIRESLAE